MIAQEKTLCDHFYLGGGTALAEFYLHHRYSEDLDFFCEHEFDPTGISVAVKKLSKKTGVIKVEYQQSFNRNLFFLHTDKEIIKTEFTYYPFPRIDDSVMRDGLSIDSLIDIAVNKIFTIYQKPRARDFIDLYCILQQETTWKMDTLIKKAQIKFDWHVDPLQLATQFNGAERLLDYPRMIRKLEPTTWQRFFKQEATKFEKKILK